MFNRTRLRVKLRFPVPQNPLQQTETQPSSYIHCCLLPVWLWLGTCLILGQAKGLWVCCSSTARGSWLCKSQATRTAPGQRRAGRLPSLTQNVQQAMLRIKRERLFPSDFDILLLFITLILITFELEVCCFYSHPECGLIYLLILSTPAGKKPSCHFLHQWDFMLILGIEDTEKFCSQL